MVKRKEIKTKIKDSRRVDLRRNQIVKGAIKVFTVKGFYNSTVREIADAAGMTEGTLYNYIRCKEDIIYIVYDYTTKILREELNEAIADIKDPEKRLKAALVQTLSSVAKYQDLVMFLYRESGSLKKEDLHSILVTENDYIELFEQLLKDYFKGKKINLVRTKVCADIVTYLPVIVSFRRWSLNRRVESMDIVTKEIVNFILHGIECIVEE
ncbi:MAG: TetR/AcrR family transcriptional regulator [Desulfobacteraceae bacterium]|nr:TetR/AcrR family transcriptional regulator [Desulfobacteraceae bacterium]